MAAIRLVISFPHDSHPDTRYFRALAGLQNLEDVMTSELPPAQRRLVFAACVAALFTAAVEGTIVATAMPTIAADLGGFSLLAWVFAAYMLTQAVTIPIYGRMADLYGRKRVLFVGLGIFLVGCVLCGFAPSMLWLVIFRALQGIGAGAVMPVTLTIVGDAYPALERVRVQPYIASVFASSSIVGPVLGAFIVQNVSWQLIFWFNIPIGLLAIGVLARFYKETPRVVEHTLDATGALLLMLSITGILLAMLQADTLGWWIVPLVIASMLAFFLFLRVEKRSPEPLLPSPLWRNRTLLACNIGSFGIGGALMGVGAFLPTYLQAVMGSSVLESGIALSVMSFSWPLAATISSRVIMVRTSYRTSAVAGGITMVAGGFSLAALAALPLAVNAQILWGWWPTASAFLIGAGMGMMNAAQHISMQEAAGAHRGIATATQQFTRQLGGSFGTAIMGAVLNLSLAAKLPNVRDPVETMMDPALRGNFPASVLHALTIGVGDSLSRVFWVSLLFTILAAATGWMVPRVKPGKLHEYVLDEV